LFIADCLSSLSLLKAGILFVDHIQLALATNDLAIGAALLDGRSYFHFFKLFAISFPPLAVLFLFPIAFPAVNRWQLTGYLYLNMILPLLKSYGDISTPTLSPGRMRM
jgi:hypothetical protein